MEYRSQSLRTRYGCVETEQLKKLEILAEEEELQCLISDL